MFSRFGSFFAVFCAYFPTKRDTMYVFVCSLALSPLHVGDKKHLILHSRDAVLHDTYSGSGHRVIIPLQNGLTKINKPPEKKEKKTSFYLFTSLLLQRP